MKTKRLIVTETKHDELLLRSIFQIDTDTSELAVIGVGGHSIADSYARTQLLDNAADIALVVDADSADPIVVEQNRQFLKHSLGEIPTNRSFRIVVIAPDILALLFRRHSVTEQLIGKNISDTDFAHAEYDPKKVLMRLLPGKDFLKTLTERLKSTDVTSLADEPDLKELKRFVQQARKTTQNAA
jgi:hypothetical protein